MCLLSYVKLGEQFVFTSNRDINILRPAAEKTTQYLINNTAISFPKDYKGGTWLAYKDNSLIILLNGASQNHRPLDKYRMSRGLILLEHKGKYADASYAYFRVEPYWFVKGKLISFV